MAPQPNHVVLLIIPLFNTLRGKKIKDLGVSFV